VLALQTEALEHRPPLVVAAVEQRGAVEVQDVEDEQLHGRRPLQGGGRSPDVHARLQPPEVGAALGVHRDDLPVEQHGRRRELPDEPLQLGVGGRDVVAVARDDRQPAGVDGDEGAHPVPLHLVRPRLVVGRQHTGGREHRPQVAGQRDRPSLAAAVRAVGRSGGTAHPYP
jgi:hypothetical protein